MVMGTSRRPRLAVLAGMGIVKLPIWASQSASLPTSGGTLNIYEPRFLEMFNSLQRQQLEAPGTPMRFGHCVSPSAAPPALIRECGIQGWPKVGSIATVTSLQRMDAGTIRVQYELSGRFQMLSLLAEEPVPIAMALDYSDDSSLSPMDAQALNALEQEVYHCLLSIEKLSRKLESADPDAAGVPGSLSASIRRFAPPPPKEKSLAELLTEAGCQAGYDMQVYGSQGSVYGKGSSAKRKTSPDPYEHVSEMLGKGQRQELFSFAAASLIDGMGNTEKLVLINSRSTLERLHFVQNAIEPYQQMLAAKVSVLNALK